MTASADLRVLFRAPAGAGRGFGHLTRCLALGRALGVRPLVALRGGQAAHDAALALGADVLASPQVGVLTAMRPDVLVIDDPVTRDADRWARAARRQGTIVVTVHDLGLGLRRSDLAIDGSVTQSRKPSGRGRVLAGTRFAVLAPGVGRPSPVPSVTPRVLIALGGGPHARRAQAIAETIAAADPRAEIRIASGFVPSASRRSRGRVRWIGSPRGLALELSRATVAVVGGGLSLYEAAAMGVPAVGVPVVKSQIPPVVAFARRRAAVSVPFDAPPKDAADKVVNLLQDKARRQALARRSRQLVDGRGASRAAAAVVKLAAGGAR
jgi:spore coat polysaccharide biosynthesis predicted glycosyltransferase SpsG